MKKKTLLLLLTVLAAFSLIAAACGDDDTSEVGATTGGDDSAADDGAAEEEPADDGAMEEEPADDGAMEEEADDGAMEEEADDGAMEEEADDGAMEEGPLPGDGVSVTMARADWTTGYMQGYLYQQLLQELGYEVSDPADLELGPGLAYLAMAQGDFDFWANSWYPGHLSWLEAEMPDGSKVGDQVSIVGEEIIAGGLQGYLVTKDFADEFGVYSLDQLNANPDAIAAYDAQDPDPGNGIADIYGCQESWTCDDIISAQIAFSGWENIQQTIAGYDVMVAEATDKANAGEPMIIYTWTPSAYITALIPGQNVYWMTVDATVDDSNPNGVEGGEKYDQRPGTANIGPDQCPAAADAGTCQLGWIAADIQVTARNEFLESNPAAAALLAEVQISVIDVSLANVEQDGGCDTNDCISGLAATWIENNRDLVDGWIAKAMAAA